MVSLTSLFALFSLIATQTHASIVDCSKGKGLFKADAFGFWPDPAERNMNSTLSYAYTVPGPDTITSGTAKYTYTMNFIPFSPTVEDLCTQTKCPILPGTYNQSSSSTFPDMSGSFDIKVEWFDGTGRLLLCAQVKTKGTRRLSA